MKKILLILLSFVLALSSFAQSAREEVLATPEKAGGIMYAYPGPQSVQTPAPRGYKPFYISHFGRHGSRWNCSEDDYLLPYGVLKAASEAGKLTSVGEEVLAKAAFFKEDARDHIGELTRLGMRQHQDIALRMFRSFPEVFKGDPEVTANSTQSPRVMVSMFYFCNKLESLNPKMRIDLDASERDSKFVADRTDEARAYAASPGLKEVQDAFASKCLHPDRLMGVLFNDMEYVDRNVNKDDLFDQLYELACMAQNNEHSDVDLLYLFEPDELFDIWQRNNYRMYSSRGSDPRGGETVLTGGMPMFRHFIEKADEYIGSGKRGATLRFSHDGYLVALTTTMQLDGCRGKASTPEEVCDLFSTWKVTPMGGNVQWIFFRNRKGDVIVKFLLNENEVGIPVETDMYPYYHWKDVRKYYADCYKL